MSRAERVKTRGAVNAAAAAPEEIERPAVIAVRVIDEKTGIKTFENVKAIRIHSKDYTVLIMADFAPMIGKVEGSVDVLSEEGEESWKDIRGFFKHQRNAFTLLISHTAEEKQADAAADPGAEEGGENG